MVRLGNVIIYNYTSHPIDMGHREGDKIVVGLVIPQDGRIDIVAKDYAEDLHGYKIYRRKYDIPDSVYETLYNCWTTAQEEGATAIVYVSSVTIQALREAGFTPPEGLIVGGIKNIAPRGQKAVAEIYAIISL